MAAKATDEIGNDASHPALKQALEQGDQTSKQWADRIDRALLQAGGSGVQQDNPIMEAHHEVSRRTRQHATDATSRDPGIVASGELAIHHWIAAFGTMASHTKQLGMDDAARDMKSPVDEAKRADDKHTVIAVQMFS